MIVDCWNEYPYIEEKIIKKYLEGPEDPVFSYEDRPFFNCESN
jgi:hypothetical protein